MRAIALALALLSGACASDGTRPEPASARSATARSSSAAVISESPSPRVVEDPPFRLALVQGGNQIPIVDHRAKLKLARFEVVVDTRAPQQGILMNVSFNSNLFGLARAGEAIAEYFQPGTGMAEEAKVKDEVLFLSSNGRAHHYLIHEPAQGVNRYHRVEQKGRRYRCRRIVSKLMTEDRKEQPLEQIRPAALYLVLFRGVNVAGRGLEHHRDYLEIRFSR